MKIAFITISSVAIITFIITIVQNYRYQQWAEKVKTGKNYAFKVNTPVVHKQLKLKENTIHYFVSGTDTNNLLIFLHPAFGDHRCFDKQVDFFSKHYKVIAIDLPGHGLSQVGNSEDKIDHAAEYIHSIMKTEGFEKADIAGVSMGSLVAQYFAFKYPAQIKSLSVLGGFSISDGNEEVVKAQRNEGIKWLFKALVSMDAFRRRVATSTVIYPESMVRYFDISQSFTRKSFIAMSGLENILKKREITKKPYPILVMAGDHESELGIKISKLLHHQEAGSELHIIKNAGHCANMDNETEFNSTLLDFLKRTGNK